MESPERGLQRRDAVPRASDVGRLLVPPRTAGHRLDGGMERSPPPELRCEHDLGVFAGDADHNGVIDFDDYAFIDNGFNNGLTGFGNGDFNYDGAIDFDDYAIIDNAFINQDDDGANDDGFDLPTD